MEKPPEIVTASELAEFVFCPEAFRLAELGHRTANQPQLDNGKGHHAHKATAERIAGVSIALGRVLIVLALLALVAWLLWR